MAGMAGRAIRIKVSDDGGTTYTAIEGSTSDDFSITREGINITDKDDLGVQTFIDDAIGTWAMSGSFEGILKSDTMLANFNSTTQFTLDCEILVGGLGTYAGKFGFTECSVTGAEGAEAATISGSVVSSGTITYTSA
jgi:predicted secreted protein